CLRAGSSGGDTSSSSVQGQRYSAAGVPQGAQFQVNSYTTNSQSAPRIASDTDGDFVMVWHSNGSSGGDTSAWSVQGQRYSAAGVPQGAQFQVNTYTTSYQLSPAIASDADGDFVVVWDSFGSSGGDTSSYSVQGQRFRVTGDLSGRAFLDQDSDGIQDAGEPGLPGIAVELYDDTSVLRRTVVTGFTGEYVLKPKEGSWTVKFVPPSSLFAFTAQNAGGDDTLDSDADPTTGETDPFPISVNVLDDTIDAGFLPLLFADGFVSGDTTAWSATVP
ncbi:MAG: large repetitive protein, partial [Acidobacteriota bacterium]|nr:large repetitive protein [Acidobacteriota bacterium]